MTVRPDPTRIAVLTAGMPQGLRHLIPNGGNRRFILVIPQQAWAKAQKNDRKKPASDKMKSAMPTLKPRTTIRLCRPIRPSIINVINQENIVYNR